MTTTFEAWGELRSTLSGHPSTRAWWTTLKLLDAWPIPEELPAVIDYVSRAISGWPTSQLRVAHPRWLANPGLASDALLALTHAPDGYVIAYNILTEWGESFDVRLHPAGFDLVGDLMRHAPGDDYIPMVLALRTCRYGCVLAPEIDLLDLPHGWLERARSASSIHEMLRELEPRLARPSGERHMWMGQFTTDEHVQDGSKTHELVHLVDGAELEALTEFPIWSKLSG